MGVHSRLAKSRETANRYGVDFVEQVGWHPSLIETFAGAVKYSQYDFITRFIMKMISKREGGSTDTTHDHEYTDWEAVSRFANKFLEAISETKSYEHT